MKLLNYKLGTNKKPIRILAISDLHVAGEKEVLKLERILDDLDNNRIHYDAILIVGDLFDATNVLRSDKETTNDLLYFIKQLGYFAPTYISYASHDLAYYSEKMKYITGQPWTPDVETFKMHFLDQVAGYHNVNVGSNKTYYIGGDYTISLYNPSLNYAMLKPDGDEEILFRESENYKFLEGLNDNDVNILACHYPNAIASLHEAGLLYNVDLAVAGHNHSGITQFIPLEIFLNMIGLRNQGLITPGKSINPHDTRYSRGMVSFGGRTKMIINPAMTTFAACTGGFK